MTAATATAAAVVEQLLTEAAPPCGWHTKPVLSAVCNHPAEWAIRVEYDCDTSGVANNTWVFFYCTAHKDAFLLVKALVHHVCEELHHCSVIYLGRI